jgi:hypothetical protein
MSTCLIDTLLTYPKLVSLHLVIKQIVTYNGIDRRNIGQNKNLKHLTLYKELQMG